MMSRLGFKSSVYHGDMFLGELDNVPVKGVHFPFPKNEIRIHHITPNSERCHPLAVLQTISAASIRCKLEPGANSSLSSKPDDSPLINLHASMFYELKTAVVLLGNEEVHLVAMPSKQKKFPCFWCYSLPCGLYNSCLWMLNTRCLAIVFDLDETLIVANTMKSFEDRIDVLVAWIARESDPIRESGMTAEMKRYVEDRALLRQYAENDNVMDGGKLFKYQLEEVPLLSDGHVRVVRPVVRLPERSIVLTRINPENRDTSVLVRLRPAWIDLKNYLTAKGRKRFEVYVCTMAERDYALEMWRLLDAEAHLISSKQLLERVVCVKSGARKSLLNVFQDGKCHPKMAMVIDDRLKVWEEKDQPRVHVVPAFTPYYAPQAETANAVPVLCVARNVACNVRGGFFKEFDEHLSRRISDIFYEDEVVNLPCVPDVSNYLMSEDDRIAANAVALSMDNNVELKPESSKLSTISIVNAFGPVSEKAISTSEKSSLLGDPPRRDNMHPGSKEPPLLPRLPRPESLLPPPQGGLTGANANRGPVSGQVPGTSPCDPLDRQLSHQHSHSHSTFSSVRAELLHVSQSKNEEAKMRCDIQKQNLLPPRQLADFGASQNQPSYSKGLKTDDDVINMLPTLSISVLQEIGRKCRSKVEFRPVVSTSNDLQFSVEVFFTGEKIGVGMGRTRKDAQQQAAENALRSLADHYVAYIAPHSKCLDNDCERNVLERENGFLWDAVKPAPEEQPLKNGFPK